MMRLVPPLCCANASRDDFLWGTRENVKMASREGKMASSLVEKVNCQIRVPRCDVLPISFAAGP